MDQGAHIFRESRCFACHGSFGDGTLGPSFGGDRMLSLSSYVISQILVGGGEMPPFANKLSDDQIAAVAQYIRNSWGNSFGPVSAQEVAQARQQMDEATQRSAPAPTRTTKRTAR
jgi:mono/diheme cytochrome c family protein